MIPSLSISQDLSYIRKQRPLILNVTNFVAMEFSANALLAIGSSPIMSLAAEEMDELVAAASAVVINMGTLNQAWMEAAERAWICAKEMNKPVIFDPVGAGATHLRNKTARRLVKEYGADVVRGNSSEILALLTGDLVGKGVDAVTETEVALHHARDRCAKSEAILIISGATDYIVSHGKTYSIANGAPEMRNVTAMGCVATCLIAAFRAVEANSFLAAAKGMAVMGICGEISARQTSGPGSLRTSFLDLLGRSDLPFEDYVRVSAL